MDENTLNDLLECSVCLDRLDTSSKVLPCQHTFCRKCLEVIVASRQELRCPECRVLVEVKIDELPPNVLLMRILEGLKNASIASKNQEKHHQNINKLTGDNETKVQSVQQTPQIGLQQQQPPANQRRCLLPHAYALYDFISTEPNDLHFKKGDLILLKHKIDSNWYVGQLNGIEGTFPSNYVQVIVPLPSPQCLALYDFKMGPNEEEGCLTFKKGALIHVLRRVDHNWAEGRIGNMIGIFPIAFVELNALAKKLLDSYEQRSITMGSSTSSTKSKETKNSKQQNLQTQSSTQQLRNLPPVPMLDPTVNKNSSDTTTTSPSSSNTTSPSASESTTGTTSSVHSNSLPNSPPQSLATTPRHYPLHHHYAHGSGSVRYRNSKEKRHSLNALLSSSGSNTTPALSILQTNRHSAEILSIPSDDVMVSNGLQSTTSNADTARPQTSAAHEQQQSTTALQGLTATPATSSSMSTPTTSRVNVLKTTCGHSNVPTTLPWAYLALYPYKPRKNDELELKKGCVYIVTERCLDGWFKGKNWQEISGVFPGNYVTPLRARDQQQLMHQWKYVSPIQSQVTQIPSVTTSMNPTNNSNGRNPSQLPPELPPRHLIAPTSTSPTTTCGSVLSKAVGGSLSKSSEPTATKDKGGDQKPSKESSALSSSASAAVNLMKRLTHIKSRAKSPAGGVRSTATSPSMQKEEKNREEQIKSSASNPQQQQQPQQQQIANLHPVHVRSGSCPSQLLQSLPYDLTTATNGQTKNGPSSQQPHQSHHQSNIQNHGSERIKGPKDRPRIQAIRQSIDGTMPSNGIYSNVNATTPALPLTIPNNFLLNTKCSQQQHSAMKHDHHHYQSQGQQHGGKITAAATNSNPSTTHTFINHRKSHSLDANSLLNGAQPTGTTGQSAMPNCNATAAAIAASATTKSSYNGRESRFRCIVPYPPNSEVELELHVGDIIYVQRKQKNGWYKGTHARTQKTGLFPASFVEPDL